MARRTSLLGLGAALTAAVTVCTMGAAHADLAPSGTDHVGIGSDTVQNIGNFVADGTTLGDPGYNTAGGKNRLISFDATPDANDRAGFAFNSTPGANVALNPTIVLRTGLKPVQRPNGSGAGVTALLADTAHNIDFVRMSRLPTTAEQSNTTAGVGPLRVIKISTDNLAVAKSSDVVSNAPATLTATQLVDLYKCNTTNFTAVGGTAGVPKPYIPQTGSGTRSAFLADLKAANGNVDVVLGSCVLTAEENDPAVIRGDANAIAPFSAGRKALYDSGYFNDPSKKYGEAVVPLTSGVVLVGGYVNTRGLYIVFRNSDVASPIKSQPGSVVNKIQDLFYNPTNVGLVVPFVNSDAGRADITAAGATPTYVDCGSGAGVTVC